MNREDKLRLLPGQWSEKGFLGEFESLESILSGDAATLQELDVTHEILANALDHLLTWGLLEETLGETRDRLERMRDDPSVCDCDFENGKPYTEHVREISGYMDDVEEYFDPLLNRLQNLNVKPAGTSKFWKKKHRSLGQDPIRLGKYEIAFFLWNGSQECPFCCLECNNNDDVVYEPQQESTDDDDDDVDNEETALTIRQMIEMLNSCRNAKLGELDLTTNRLPLARYASVDFTILNTKTGQKVRGPGLIGHLIREHQFFEGKGSPYRVEPKKLCSLFEIETTTPKNNNDKPHHNLIYRLKAKMKRSSQLTHNKSKTAIYGTKKE